MKRVNMIIVLSFVFILFLASFSVMGKSENEKVDKKIYDKIKEDESAKVFVKFKESAGKSGKSTLGNNVKEDFGSFVVANVNSSELDELEENPNVERISLVGTKRIFLQDSVPLINASYSNSLVLNGVNLTGKGQTVCIIDTGVNYSHPDLGGCFGANCKVIGGYDFVNNDADPMDDNGHGTHVAGIIAANGSINGVAPEAKIVALKVCNSGGSCSDNNVISAINWCVGNSSVYNISVISMSLGGAFNFTSYCDSDTTENSDIYAAPINSAFAKNISFAISSGNSGNSTSVSSPACIQNATRVGATTKSDGIASYSNRWALDMLFAPGSAINSTMTISNTLGCTGLYCEMSGTSMATQHVAGAIAILNQYLNSTGTTKTPREIETLLNNTGKMIYDSSSNRNYSRINVYDAIKDLSFGVISTSPGNGLFTRANLTVECNSSSTAGLSDITFNIWNSTALVYTSNASVSGVTNSSSFIYNFTNEDNYLWGCSVTNSLGLVKASSNFTVSYDLTPPSLTVVSPVNLSYYNAGRFNVSLNENGSCVYSLNLGIVNNSMNSSNNQVFSSINSSIFEGEYNVSYYCNDSTGNLNSTLLTFYVDLTPPNVTLNSPASGYSATGTTTILFDYNVTDNINVSYCSLIMNSASVASNSSAVIQGNNNISKSVSSGSYNWQINCTDIAGNIGNSSIRSLTINAEASVSSSSGGGGGGGSSSGGTTYSLTESQVDSGFSKALIEKDKIKFDFDNNGNTEQHSITTNKVYTDRVDLTIASNPVNISLFIAEEKKISLVSGLYNLYIKLNSITDGKANLTIRTINEPISASTPSVSENIGEVNESNSEIVQSNAQVMEIPINFGKIIGSVGIVVLGVVIIVVLWLVFGRRKHSRKKSRSKLK